MAPLQKWHYNTLSKHRSPERRYIWVYTRGGYKVRWKKNCDGRQSGPSHNRMLIDVSHHQLCWARSKSRYIHQIFYRASCRRESIYQWKDTSGVGKIELAYISKFKLIAMGHHIHRCSVSKRNSAICWNPNFHNHLQTWIFLIFQRLHLTTTNWAVLQLITWSKLPLGLQLQRQTTAWTLMRQMTSLRCRNQTR